MNVGDDVNWDIVVEGFNQGIILGYNFATRLLMQLYDIREKAVDYQNKEFEFLQKITQGEFTLFNSPTEQFAKFPNMKEDFADHIRRTIGKAIKMDQYIANVLQNRFD